MYTKGSLSVEASVGCFGLEASSVVEAIVCGRGCVALLEEVPTTRLRLFYNKNPVWR